MNTLVLYSLVLLTVASTTRAVSSSSSVSGNSTASDGLDWFCDERGVETDYIKLAHKIDDYYFYWFVRSRSASAATDPLVVWLNGGPGSSSLGGLIAENGPCLVQEDLSVKRNAYAWNNNANMIWLEQPSFVGFSYSTDESDLDHTGEDIARNAYAFLNSFVDKHPEFVGRPLYITGESYAGHYVPAVAHYIWTMNKQLVASDRRLNLQGLAIGNGDQDFALQNKYAAAMATNNNYNLTLLTDAQIAQMNADADECARLYPTCVPYNDSAVSCFAISDGCDGKMLTPFVDAHRNAYDIRKSCTNDVDCFDYGGSREESFVNSDVVKKALPAAAQNITWIGYNDYVSQRIMGSGDWARSYTPEFNELLNDGLRVLIYAGDADLVCNWLGNRAWTLSLGWKGSQGYNATGETPFTVPLDPLGLSGTATGGASTVAGSKWEYENLAFVRFDQAGHSVPQDQPLAAFVMLNRFLNNKPMELQCIFACRRCTHSKNAILVVAKHSNTSRIAASVDSRANASLPS